MKPAIDSAKGASDCIGIYSRTSGNAVSAWSLETCFPPPDIENSSKMRMSQHCRNTDDDITSSDNNCCYLRMFVYAHVLLPLVIIQSCYVGS